MASMRAFAWGIVTLVVFAFVIRGAFNLNYLPPKPFKVNILQHTLFWKSKSDNILPSGSVFASTFSSGSTTTSCRTISDNKHDLVRGTAPHFFHKFKFASILNPSVKESQHATSVIPSYLTPKTSNSRSVIMSVLSRSNIAWDKVSKFYLKVDLKVSYCWSVS